jgi:hypothetical protein
MMIGPDIPSGFSPASAPIELIDVVFALSNIRLVKEIVQDNLKQLSDLDKVSKRQTEGIKMMIVQKQEQAYRDLDNVEKTPNRIVEDSLAQAGQARQRDVSLGPEQSRALIGALSLTIRPPDEVHAGHLAARARLGDDRVNTNGTMDRSIFFYH